MVLKIYVGKAIINNPFHIRITYKMVMTAGLLLFTHIIEEIHDSRLVATLSESPLQKKMFLVFGLGSRVIFGYKMVVALCVREPMEKEHLGFFLS